MSTVSGENQVSNSRKRVKTSKDGSHAQKKRKTAITNLESAVTSGMKPLKSNATSSNARNHVRFGSEEPGLEDEANGAGEDNANVPTLTNDIPDYQEDSDDDAPETVSAATAVKATKAAAAGVAQSVQQQKIRDRRKRQERDARLKERAAQSERKSANKEGVQASQVGGSDGDEVQGEELLPTASAEIEDLLPEELLAEDFTRPPTPPPTTRQPQAAKRQKATRIQPEDKKPKTVSVGSINVAVLEKANRLLPSKPSSHSRNMREGWLAGRRAKGVGGGLERKPFTTRFIAR